mmetsp:Transcript_1687/g.2883  ORF Transcript_1687/g.2883 Transcript_1687/m.2883 type:complete len:232 (-) Transcript_1687:365-1060(-)
MAHLYLGVAITLASQRRHCWLVRITRLRFVCTMAHAPHPRIAEPQLRDHVDLRSLMFVAIGDNGHDQNVLRAELGVLDINVKVLVVVKHSSIQDLELWIVPVAVTVLRQQFLVGIRRLRILVASVHVRMGWGAVQEIVELLAILSVVAFRVGQPIETLLEDSILVIPQGEAVADTLLFIAESQQAVLTPSVCAAACVFVGKEPPRIAVLTVILPDGGPLAISQVRPPELPL